MRFQISKNDSRAERKLKTDLNSLFFIELEELIELAEPYFLIRKRGGIICTQIREIDSWAEGSKRYYIDDHERIPAEKVEYLINKKVIGKKESIFQPRKVFLFDNFDARFNDAIKHPLGIETYYELKYEAGHSDENIPILLKEILSKYDRLKRVIGKNIPRKRILATAIALTCRGKYQCPVNMKKYFNIAGGPSAVQRAGEKIGESIRYDSDAKVRAYILKLGLEKRSIRKFMELWKKEKKKFPTITVTTPYIGGLAYLAAKLTGQPISQKYIADRIGVAEVSVRAHAQKIASRQNIEFQRKLNLSSELIRRINRKFRKELGFPPSFGIEKYTLDSLKKRLELAEYLLENNHDKRNPITRDELIDRLNLSNAEFYRIIGMKYWYEKEFRPYISPLNAGVEYNGKLYIKNIRKLRKYVRLMREVVNSALL